jgi:hypothetical protein
MDGMTPTITNHAAEAWAMAKAPRFHASHGAASVSALRVSIAIARGVCNA